ncbi:MAG: membrane dipeptidase [Phycisphaerae bacterium]|nr:membrane dipeptidase [Phycisphaerae bacterium]
MNDAPPIHGPTHARIPFIDGHLDLAYVGISGAASGRVMQTRVPPGVDGCVSWPDLADAPVRIALGTIFTETRSPDAPAGYRDSDDVEGAHRAGLAQLRWYEAEEAAGRIRLVRTRADLEQAAAAPATDPIAIVLLMEGADPIRTPEEAPWWFERGVRVVGMSWAYGSRYSGGNAEGGPLTPAGRDLVAAFDALGVLHDVSHLSDRSFDDLLACTSKRVVATHSNCRALLAPRERHLTDAQIRAVAARDGVIGLNLFGKFLAEDREPTIDDCVNHVHHVAALVGNERVALGSDLDGGFGASGLPRGVRHPREFGALAARIGIYGFAHANWLRVLRAVFVGR